MFPISRSRRWIWAPVFIGIGSNHTDFIFYPYGDNLHLPLRNLLFYQLRLTS